MSISTRSRMMSFQPTTPARTRNRSAPRRPSASLAARSAGVSAAQRPTYRGGSFVRLLGLPVRVELLGRAEAGIGVVGGQQALGRRRVLREALHLAVRGVRPRLLATRDARALVPGDAQPVEAVEDVLLERVGAPGDVRVLEPEHERAAGVAGEQVVEQRGPRGPDVERPGGAGRDAHADVGSHAGYPASVAGTWWNRPGSASPSRTRMSAAGRSPSVARPRGPSRVSESRLSDRARTVTCAPGVSARASR